MPSVIEFATGKILASVNIPLHDIPLRQLLTERMGVPVYVENDAGCAALAEAFEDGRMTVSSLVMFTIGTGVGGGWVLNGRLYRGATTSAAEVGHTIIGRDLEFGNNVPGDPFPQRGSLETLASGRALDRLADYAAIQYRDSYLGKMLAQKGNIDGHDVVAGAKAGDEPSLWCLRVLGERLGIGIANAINTFDPLEVVIGGGVSHAGELLLEPARDAALPARRARAGAEHHDPHRAPRAARGRARRGADRRPGVRRGHGPEPAGRHIRGGGILKIACAFDHAGFPLKAMVLETVAATGHEVDRPRHLVDRSRRLPGHRPARRRGRATATPTAPCWSAAPARAWPSRPASSRTSAPSSPTTPTPRTSRSSTTTATSSASAGA